MAAGASFIVAPGFDPEVCKHVIDKGGIMMPGTASAGEMQQAMEHGLRGSERSSPLRQTAVLGC